MAEQRDENGNVIGGLPSLPVAQKEQRDENGVIVNLQSKPDLTFEQQQAARSPAAQISAPPLSFADRLKSAMNPFKGGSETINPKDITSFLPMLGAMMAPETGGGSLLLSALGAGSGSLLKQGINEKLEGTNPSLGETLPETTSDVIGQTVFPKILGAAFQPRLTVSKALANPLVRKVFPEIENTTSRIQAEAMTHPETGILESAATNTDDIAKDFVSKYNAAPDVKSQNAIWGEYQDKLGTNSVGQSLLRLNRDVASGGSVANQQAYKSITRSALSDVSQVRNFKLATGEDTTIRQLAQNDVLSSAFKGKAEFDPDSVLSKLEGNKQEVYQEALGPAFSNLKQLAEEAPKATGRTIISYVKHKLLWVGMATGVGMLSGHELTGAAIGGSYVLGDFVVGKAMEDPLTASLVLRAMKTPLSAPEAPMLQKLLVNGLRGAEAYSHTSEGDEKVIVGPDGRPQLRR